MKYPSHCLKDLNRKYYLFFLFTGFIVLGLCNTYNEVTKFDRDLATA